MVEPEPEDHQVEMGPPKRDDSNETLESISSIRRRRMDPLSNYSHIRTKSHINHSTYERLRWRGLLTAVKGGGEHHNLGCQASRDESECPAEWDYWDWEHCNQVLRAEG